MAPVTTFSCLLVLLVVANGTPVLARRFFGLRGAWPVDGGRYGADGYRLLGKSKTWRGLVTAIISTAIVADAFGLGLAFGAAFGALAMLGDLVSSYLKRRWGLESSARAAGIDQFPEAVLPLLLSHWWWDIGWLTIIIATFVFYLLVTRLSPLLFRMGIRRRPH